VKEAAINKINQSLQPKEQLIIRKIGEYDTINFQKLFGLFEYYDGDENIFYLKTSKSSSLTEEEAKLETSTNIFKIDRNTGAMIIGSEFGGLVVVNLTSTQKNNMTSPETGTIIFDTTLGKLCVYTGADWETITSS